MIAGRLNEHITIARLRAVKNRFGEVETNDYVPVCKTRAEVQYNNGNRAVENNAVVFAYGITFNVRHYVDVDELDRIEWEGQEYRIMSIEIDKKYMMKRLRCELINE